MNRHGAIDVGVGLPHDDDGPGISGEWWASWVVRAEDAGFTSLWVGDSGLGRRHGPTTVPALAAAAVLTRRARLGVAVLILRHHSPVRLAQDLASIDRLSGGRLLVGIGLGRRQEEDPAYGLHAGSPRDRFVEAIDALNHVWASDPVRVTGRNWLVAGRPVGPKPLQEPRPPLLFGGRADAALERAAELGDGWIGSGSSSYPEFAAQVERLDTHLRAAGRPGGDFAKGKRVYIGVGADRSRVLERLRGPLTALYRDPDIADRVVVAGDIQDCAAELDRLRALGVSRFILHPVFDHDSQLELLAEVRRTFLAGQDDS